MNARESSTADRVILLAGGAVILGCVLLLAWLVFGAGGAG